MDLTFCQADGGISMEVHCLPRIGIGVRMKLCTCTCALCML